MTSASVQVQDRLTGRIDAGILALVAVEPGDAAGNATRLLQRLLEYRIFDDGNGRMNRSLRDTGGGLLLVPQFTLAADTASGTRPGFSTAAPPALARELFGELLRQAQAAWPAVASGEFGAHMQVALVNDGPVTFWLEA